MNTAIFHFVSGDAFFSGLACVFIGALVTRTSKGKLYRSGRGAILFGWVLIVASATAIPLSIYAFFGVLSLSAVVFASRIAAADSHDELIHADAKTESKCGSGGLDIYGSLCAAALGVAVFEVVYHRSIDFDVPRRASVFVIGDSLSAGINDGEDIPWPTRLNPLTASPVSNHAQAGATCRSALKQLDGLPKQCVVIVEIGGNDLLSGRSSSEFRTDLDALLSELQSPDREVIMFELPLPPLFNGYGYAQRELAAKHNVALIPRRLLASVLFSQDATLDSIHLSDRGHQRLAEGVAETLSLDAAK